MGIQSILSFLRLLSTSPPCLFLSVLPTTLSRLSIVVRTTRRATLRGLVKIPRIFLAPHSRRAAQSVSPNERSALHPGKEKRAGVYVSYHVLRNSWGFCMQCPGQVG